MQESKKLNQDKEKKHFSLTSLIFLSLIAGALTGIVFHYLVPAGYVRDTVFIDGIFYVLGQGFLRLMQMLVVPLVFSSLICGSAAVGDTATLGKIGLKTMVFYLATTALAITMAIVVGGVINPGTGLDTAHIKAEDISVSESVSIQETILNVIPKNPVASLADGDMLPIIIFAIFIGIILAKLGSNAGTVIDFFKQFNDIMMEMTDIVMKAAPVGVFCLIARTFAGIGFNAFFPLLKYMFAVLLALGIHCFIIYMILFKGFTSLSPVKFIRKFIPVMGFAFTTATSNATIPLSIETLERDMGISRKISSFTVPLGATINMDGTAIMQVVATLFIAGCGGYDVSVFQLVIIMALALIASMGTPAAPGAGAVILFTILSGMGYVNEGSLMAYSLILAINRPIEMLVTSLNVVGDSTTALYVAKTEGMLDEDKFNA